MKYRMLDPAPPSNPHLAEFGDESGGFKTAVDAHMVRVVAWGFWTKEVAQTFEEAVLAACRNTPGLETLYFDMTRLKPMRDEGQEGFARLMSALSVLGVSGATVVTSSPLTRLQLLRIARENAGKDLVNFLQSSDT